MAAGGVPECCHRGKRDSFVLPARKFAGPARIGISPQNRRYIAACCGGMLRGQW
jgi:hypothetical protein